MDKFTRANIQEILQSGADMDIRKAKELTGKIIKAMAAALANGCTVELRGFGSLEVKERKAYTARNPKTGETLTTPDRRRVVFHPGQELKAALRGKTGTAIE